MKPVIIFITAILAFCLIISCTVSTSTGENSSIPKTNTSTSFIEMKNSDLKEFVNKARTYAIENGKEKALAAFNDRNGPFTKGELYIFAYDYDGYTLALPYEPSFIGSNRLSIFDSSTFRLLQAIRDTAVTGPGFVKYSNENPAKKFKEEGKVSYITDVDGSWFLGAGRYTNNTGLIPKKGINTDLQKNLNFIFKNSTTQLKNIDSALKETANALSTTGLTGPEAEAALKKLSESNPYSIDTITILTNGTIVAVQPSEYSSVIGKNIADQAHIKKLFATNTPQMSNLIETVEGDSAIDIAYPVFNSNGEIIGATTLLLNDGAFFSGIVNSTGSPQIEATVMQKDGTIIYDKDKGQVGKNGFYDPLFKDFNSLQSLIKRISAEKSGLGTYIFIRGATPDPVNPSSQRDDIVNKGSAWTTIGLYGNDLKIIINQII